MPDVTFTVDGNKITAPAGTPLIEHHIDGHRARTPPITEHDLVGAAH